MIGYNLAETFAILLLMSIEGRFPMPFPALAV